MILDDHCVRILSESIDEIHRSAFNQMRYDFRSSKVLDVMNCMCVCDILEKLEPDAKKDISTRLKEYILVYCVPSTSPWNPEYCNKERESIHYLLLERIFGNPESRGATLHPLTPDDLQSILLDLVIRHRGVDTTCNTLVNSYMNAYFKKHMIDMTPEALHTFLPPSSRERNISNDMTRMHRRMCTLTQSGSSVEQSVGLREKPRESGSSRDRSASIASSVCNSNSEQKSGRSEKSGRRRRSPPVPGIASGTSPSVASSTMPQEVDEKQNEEGVHYTGKSDTSSVAQSITREDATEYKNKGSPPSKSATDGENCETSNIPKPEENGNNGKTEETEETEETEGNERYVPTPVNSPTS